MRKVLVLFTQENEKLQRYIIENWDDLELYMLEFPEKYPIVKKSFEKCLNNGQRIIVHLNGSWCTENQITKILMYI